jgi:hypothetical protein
VDSARPDRHRLLRLTGIGLLGLAVGIGATVAVSRAGGRPERAASVQRLDLPAGAAPAGAAAPAALAEAAPVRAGTARAAVGRFLQAEAGGDLAAAYGLLDRAGRGQYPSLARFTRAQADRAGIAAVRVGRERRTGDGRAEVTVTLSHPPAIDPFTGLVPGRTVEVWPASRQDGRWRVAASPVSVRAQLPGDGHAPEAVSAWVQRLLGCDLQGAAGLQAGAELYGPADLPQLPCKERGRWTVAAPQTFDAAVEPEAYVAAFGPEVGAWARLVPVQGPRTRFSVVVGPVGDTWRVLGTDPVKAR